MSVFGASIGKEAKEKKEREKKEKKGPSRKSQIRGAIRSRAGKPVRFRLPGGVSKPRGMFKDPTSGGGVIGWVIAFVMLMALIYYYSSLSGISPINNSTIANDFGCNTCGPGGTPGGAYQVIKPFGLVFYGAIPLLFAYGLIRRRQELQGEDEMVGELEE